MFDLAADSNSDSNFYSSSFCMRLNQLIVKNLGGTLKSKSVDSVGNFYRFTVPVENVNSKANQRKFYLNKFIKTLVGFDDPIQLKTSFSNNDSPQRLV